MRTGRTVRSTSVSASEAGAGSGGTAWSRTGWRVASSGNYRSGRSPPVRSLPAQSMRWTRVRSAQEKSPHPAFRDIQGGEQVITLIREADLPDGNIQPLLLQIP